MLAGEKSGRPSARAQRDARQAQQAQREAEEEARRLQEHRANKRPSARPKHEEGQARKARDARGEKGDKRRSYVIPFPMGREVFMPDYLYRRFLPIPKQIPGETDEEFEERSRPWV